MHEQVCNIQVDVGNQGCLEISLQHVRQEGGTLYAQSLNRICVCRIMSEPQDYLNIMIATTQRKHICTVNRKTCTRLPSTGVLPREPPEFRLKQLSQQN